MKKLFDFGKKEDAGEQMQSSYDFVETPEIFKEFKEPSAPAEETNLLKLYTDKA